MVITTLRTRKLPTPSLVDGPPKLRLRDDLAPNPGVRYFFAAPSSHALPDVANLKTCLQVLRVSETSVLSLMQYLPFSALHLCLSLARGLPQNSNNQRTL